MIQGFFRSCYDFPFLLGRRKAPWGPTLGHLAVLALALSAARTVSTGAMVIEMLDRGAQFVRQEMPEVRIENGVASTQAIQPWKKDFEGTFQLVIDTTGGTTEVAPAFPTGILIARRTIRYKRGPGQFQEFKLEPVKSFSTRGPKMDQMVEDIRRWVRPVLAPISGLLTVLGIALRLLLTAAIGMALAGALRVRFGFHEMLKLAAYSFTPAALLIILGTLTPIRVLLVPTLAHLFFFCVPLWLAKPRDENDELSGRETTLEPESPEEGPDSEE